MLGTQGLISGCTSTGRSGYMAGLASWGADELCKGVIREILAYPIDLSWAVPLCGGRRCINEPAPGVEAKYCLPLTKLIPSIALSTPWPPKTKHPQMPMWKRTHQATELNPTPRRPPSGWTG